MGITTYDSRKLPDAWQPERRASAPTTHGVPGTAASWGVQTAPMPAVSPMHVQAKLRINQPGDRFEQEADRVADAVVAGRPASLGVPAASGNAAVGNAGVGNAVTGGSVQRKCAECDKEEEERVVQRMAVSTAAPSASSAAATSDLGGGSPLPGATRARMEAVIGADFSGVRVHAGPEAASRASALNARAFTAGRDVVFGAGEYRPGTSSGDRLLAHELTHVVQQSRGLVDEVQREDDEKATSLVYQAKIVTIPEKDSNLDTRYSDDPAQRPKATLVQVHFDEGDSLLSALELVRTYNVNAVVVVHTVYRKGDNKRYVGIGKTLTSEPIYSIDTNRVFPSTRGSGDNAVDASPSKESERTKVDELLKDKSKIGNEALSAGGRNSDAAKSAVVAFRTDLYRAIDSMRRVKTETGEDGLLPILYLHNNSAGGKLKASTYTGDGENARNAKRVYSMTRAGSKTSSGGAVAADPGVTDDDFVIVTKAEDYAALTGQSILDSLDMMLNEISSTKPADPGVRKLKKKLDEAITKKNSASILTDVIDAFRKSELFEGVTSDVWLRLSALASAARNLNVILQSDLGPTDATGLENDGSASVFFRDERFLNMEIQSGKQGGQTKAYAKNLDRARRMVEYLGAEQRTWPKEKGQVALLAKYIDDVIAEIQNVWNPPSQK